MSDDARFEDAQEKPLNIGAFDVEDLKIVSALAQDAVFPAPEMAWRPEERRFALLINRFRWEDGIAAGRRDRPFERVQSVLVIENVLGVASTGFDRADPDLVLSLLDVEWHPTDAPAGHVVLTLAGDGAIRLDVEALEVGLRDVTRPYVALSRKMPDHGE